MDMEKIEELCEKAELTVIETLDVDKVILHPIILALIELKYEYFGNLK